MSQYTPEELKTILQAPMMFGLAVALVDMGIVSTAIEAAAMSKQIAGAAEKYPHNSIMQAAFAETNAKKLKLNKPEVRSEDIQSGEIVDQALTMINAALRVVRDRAPDRDVEEYKQFIYDCSEAVAKAAGSGLFGTGAKVSAKEAEALAKLKLALGI